MVLIPALAASPCSNFDCQAPAGTPAGEGAKFCPTPTKPNPKCNDVSPPPRVKRFKFYNACEWDIALFGWECIIPSNKTCYVGEPGTCFGGEDNDLIQTKNSKSLGLADFFWAQFSGIFSANTSNFETLPICSEVSPTRKPDKPYPTRVAWYIVDSVGSGGASNYHIMDMVEVNSTWMGPGNIMDPPSFSSYDGFSMSRYFTALTVDEDDNACIDSGGYSTVPDPIARGNGVYDCGYPPFQNPGGAGTDPGWACKQGNPMDPTYLKQNAYAVGSDAVFMSPDTCAAVEYPCVDACTTGEHNWPEGTMMCDCPEEIVFFIQSCKVTA